MQFRDYGYSVVSAILILLCARCIALAEETLSQDQQTQIRQAISKLMTERGVPGLTVAIATNNELRYCEGFGEADVENGVKATAATKYRTASVAKPMTATVVMSLVEAGIIDLDAEVQQYCAEYSQKQWPLTTRQLLAHLGGVRHYKDRHESSSTNHYFSLKSALTTFRDDPLVHEPGSKYLYSSFGYNLLGSIAEGASGQSFAELLQEKVLAPSGMCETGVDDQHSIIPSRARGYVRPTAAALATLPSGHALEEGKLYNAALHDTSMKIPGGGLLATAADLLRFACAINTGRLLNEESRQQMWTNQKTSDGKLINYGFGWRVQKRFGTKLVSHTGGQSGASTILLLVPETGTSVAIMSNLQNLTLTDTAWQLAAIVDPALAVADSQEQIAGINYTGAIERLKSAIRYEVTTKQLPAFSIAVVDKEQLVWSEGFGFQDTEQLVPATADTVYRVGSVSKLFTDIAVMQLTDRGEIDLDEPVQRYLSEFAPNNPSEVPITLRRLMSHRSGLVRESPIGNYFDPDEPSLSQTVASLNDTALVYEPDSKTKYSNAAVAVVGAVLESQLNNSHPEQVCRTILEPLGMHNSSFVVTEAIASKLAMGWMRTYDGRRFEAPTFLLGTGPAGNMYASVNDLSKFVICLLNEGESAAGRILHRQSLETMMTPIKNAAGEDEAFGLGFHVQTLDGNRKIGHGGAVYGFSSQLEALPQRGLGVVAAASLDGSNGVVGRLANYALRLMIAVQDGDPLPDYRTTEPVPPQRAKELVGTYYSSDDSRFIRISELSGDLFMQRDAYRYQLRAAADNGAIVTDDVLGYGTEVKLNRNQGIRINDTLYKKVVNEPPPDIPDRWKGLIGEYGWDHNTLYILEDNEQLYALIEWFYYYPLKEIGDDVFEFPPTGLYHGERLFFSRNAAGVATAVTAAEVHFLRRDVGVEDGETFRIVPLKAIDDLRAEALAASPPAELGGFLDSGLTELVLVDPTIKLDIRYATTNNFSGAVFYEQSRAFLQRDAADALGRVHDSLKPRGLGLLIYDAYRPWHVTKMFWDATPDALRRFVANPANGSRHNRGCAVDLTLYELHSGEPVQMVAGYDEFSSRSLPLYPGGTSRQRWYRELLREAMEKEGFAVYEHEWWHFDFKDWKKYRIENVTFEDILKQ
jgi:CubicO group peptidase (beta-lactamase class C family)/D-alanyl-D-alanine dipeptidase